MLVALITPVLIHWGWLPDANAGLANPIYNSPSWGHWCGTDRLGRDVCVRTMAGSGVALQVVMLAVGFALVLGVPLGLVSGYFGGAIDRTLVLLMAVERMELFAAALLKGGRPAQTPVLAVQHGTTAAERIVRATLSDVPERLRSEGIRPPAVIVIGPVAAFETLSGL